MKKASLFAILAAALLFAGYTFNGSVIVPAGSYFTAQLQRFSGATGVNFLKLPDNTAVALTIEDYENGADIATVKTTDSAEQWNWAVPVTPSLAATVTAAGSSKTDCTALTKEFNVVSTATTLQGVCLLAASAGMHQVVRNGTAVAIIVYPLDAGDDQLRINQLAALTADAGFAIGPGGALDCTAADGTTWYCHHSLGITATVAAAGTGQTTYTAFAQVQHGSNVSVTGADGTKGVTLPSGANPTCLRIHNIVSNQVLVVDGNNSDDDTIDGGSADGTQNIGASASVLYCTTNGTAWVTY